MVNSDYVPKTGDLVWLDFDPTRGHEQKKRRPALVLSPDIFNRKTSLMLVCPVTSAVKKYPFEVELRGKKVSGVILSDQIRSLDWTVRNVEYIGKASPRVIRSVKENLATVLEL